MSIPRTIALALLVALTVACAALSRESLPPSLRAEFDAIVLAEEAAAETPEPEDDAEVEARWAELEGKSAKDQASPWTALLPYGLAPLALELVGALGSRRKRKLYGSAVKNISKGQVASAAGDALKAWGVQHSTPQPQPPQS